MSPPVFPARETNKHLSVKLLKEKIIKYLLLLAALSSIVIVFSIIAEVVYMGYPQIIEWFAHGFGMEWIPSSEETTSGTYGIIPFIFSTVYVGVGSMVIGTGIGLPCAIYLSEFADSKLRNLVKPALEVLTGFPSVIIGLIGLTLVASAINGYLGYPGLGVLAAWIVLGVMSLPTIASVSEDSLRAVPNELREASLGLGATKWQTVTRVLLPAAKSGILASLMLALGAAMGETMAVIMVIGDTLPSPSITLDPHVMSNVLTSIISAGSKPDASSGEWWHAIFAAAFILFIIVAALNLGTRLILSRNKDPKKAGTKIGRN